jgi:di/tricarboxylate transporter
MLALTGTPVNVIASDAARDAGVGRFGFFEFTLVGVPLVMGTILVLVLLGDRVLPDRSPSSLPPDLSAHARTLGRQYFADHRVARLRVLPGSSCIGRPSEELGELVGRDVDVVGVQVDGQGAPTTTGSLDAGDVVILRAGPESVRDLASSCGLELDTAPFAHDPSGALLDRDLGVAEVVIPPRSGMVGARVFPGMVTDSGDLVVLAVQRKGEDRGARETRLAVGDTLLLQGEWSRLGHHVGADPDVVVVDAPELVRRHAVPLGARSTPAIAVLAAMVVLLATGVVPAAVAGLLAAAAMVLVGAVSVEQAYRGISWTTVVLVAAMIPMSTAMTESGAAEHAPNVLVDLVGGSSPYVLLLGLFVLTVVLGQLVSNMATALIVIPVAASAAGEVGVSLRPVLMCVAVAAAAALLTPVATPANLMIMEPAGYRFGDYWKVGLPLLGVYLVVAVVLVPVVWSF